MNDPATRLPELPGVRAVNSEDAKRDDQLALIVAGGLPGIVGACRARTNSSPDSLLG